MQLVEGTIFPLVLRLINDVEFAYVPFWQGYNESIWTSDFWEITLDSWGGPQSLLHTMRAKFVGSSHLGIHLRSFVLVQFRYWFLCFHSTFGKHTMLKYIQHSNKSKLGKDRVHKWLKPPKLLTVGVKGYPIKIATSTELKGV